MRSFVGSEYNVSYEDNNQGLDYLLISFDATKIRNMSITVEKKKKKKKATGSPILALAARRRSSRINETGK
jgi:hypothetical protein